MSIFIGLAQSVLVGPSTEQPYLKLSAACEAQSCRGLFLKVCILSSNCLRYCRKQSIPYLHLFLSAPTTRWMDFFEVKKDGVFMVNSFQEMMGLNRVLKSIR